MANHHSRRYSEPLPSRTPVVGQCIAPRELVQLARAVHSAYSTIDSPACASLARRAARLALCVASPPRQSASAFLWLDDVHYALISVLSVASRVRKYGNRSSVLHPIRTFFSARIGDGPERDLQKVRAAARTLGEWLSAFAAVHTPANGDNESLGTAQGSRRYHFSVFGQASQVAAVPPLPSRYVSINAAQTDEVKTCLLRIAAGESSTNVVCISGVWGVGKTTFTTTLAIDSTVVDAFPDGVAWIRLGPFMSDSAFLCAMASALSITTGADAASEARHLVSPTPAALAGIGRDYQLQTSRCLLILDDVEGPSGASRLGAVLSMFATEDSSAPRRFAVIFATSQRAKELVAWDTVEFPLRAMAPLSSDARLMFDAWANLSPLHSKYDSAARSRLVLSCGGFPIALALTGAALRKSKFAWENASAMLDTTQAGGLLVGCDGESTVSLVLKWITSLCGDDFWARMGAVSALPRGVLVPEAVLAGLWCTEPVAARRVIQSVELLAFGTSEPVGPDGQLALRLHDIVHVYCARHAESPVNYHRLLVDECGKTAGVGANCLDHQSQGMRCRPWWKVASGNDYIGIFLGWHLVRGSLRSELLDLLLDYRWIVGRLGNVCALRDDYKTLLTSPEDIADRGNIVTLSALVVDACACVETDSMLAFELHTCLSDVVHRGDLAARRVLASVYENARRPWFRPLQSSWRRVGGTQHKGFVTKLVACDSGSMPAAASVGQEGDVKVWSLIRGEEGALLWDLSSVRQESRKDFSVASVSEDFVLGGSVDGFVKIWSLRLARTVRSRRSHMGAVTAIASTAVLDPGNPFYIVSGSTDGSVVAFDLFSRSWERIFPSCSMDEITALFVLTERRAFLVGSYDGFASLWSLETGERSLSLNGHKDHVTQFRALDGPRHLFASSCSSGFAYVWSADDGSLLWIKHVGYDLTSFSLELYCSRHFARDTRDSTPTKGPYFCARSAKRDEELVALRVSGGHEVMARAAMTSSITAIEEIRLGHRGQENEMIVLVGLSTGLVVPVEVVTGVATKDGQVPDIRLRPSSRPRIQRRSTLKM